MPRHEDSSSETSEESRRQISKRTAHPVGSAGQKQAPQTPAVMSGGATDADIRLNNDRDIRDYKKDKYGVTHEPVGTKPDYRPTKPKIDWRAKWDDALDTPKIEGSTNDKDYFSGRKPPQRSSFPREEGYPDNKGKGKGKGKGKA